VTDLDAAPADATRYRSVAAPAPTTEGPPEEQPAAPATRLHDRERDGAGEGARTPGATTMRPSMGRTHGAASLEPGVVIGGRYVLDRLIGSGGMGQVWRAKDLVGERARDPNPFAAIKLLNADIEADSDAFMALQRETKKAHELAHPNVITVYSFDIDGGSGRAFMSMELLEGASLDAVIRAHSSGLTRAEASPLIVGMARGLGYAHKDKGLVHSDFKPGNVFRTKNGVPKILDFGIARAANVVGVERPEDSFDVGTLGGITMAYASPEMIEHREPHPADDVFALGLVAYELLTGRHPFGPHDAVKARDRGLKPERIRSLRRYEWNAIARALEFDRAKRWQNAGEFLRAYEGKSAATKILGALAIGSALIAGVFWYQGYSASRPAPFESLPAEIQQEFREHMTNAAGEWRLVQQGNGDESLNAASEFGKAYALHPRDAEAAAGLEKAADFIVDRLRRVDDRAERLQQLKALQGMSDFYLRYKPLTSAIEEAGGGK
jgi:hypothetical protein